MYMKLVSCNKHAGIDSNLLIARGTVRVSQVSVRDNQVDLDASLIGQTHVNPCAMPPGTSSW